MNLQILFQKKFGCISIIYDFIFLYSWSLFKEHVNEVHPDSKNKELVKLHIYAGFETSPKHKVQGKIGIVVIVVHYFQIQYTCSSKYDEKIYVLTKYKLLSLFMKTGS